ncbi:MAG: helix-turn-helix domain-containing protein [Microbacteriaceae bacterium]|nr:helix-turn-helix domain-containing protein [Microbacteriaceae bacterium]MCL2794979.1 helix-turn-helix domain-containing protein [Microbacteriaceae bacterium]
MKTKTDEARAIAPLLLTEAEAAAILRINRTTLARLVEHGICPLKPVNLTPRIRRYRVADIEALTGSAVGVA